MAFENPIGLLALGALIPFIILYLRRPKPKNEVIPSLMFLVQENKRSKKFSFFQQLMSNLLFLIQLLILLLLGLAVAGPTVNLPYDVTKENTVIIVDASASMQVEDGASTRFAEAVDEARGFLSGRNTIILAENTPVVAVEEAGSDLARDVLGRLRPRATTSNLGDAMLLAKDILGDNPGRVVLISDFLSTEGPDVQVVRTTLTSEDKVVDFVDVGSRVENTGIIDLEVGKFSSKVLVKNLNDEPVTREITINKDGSRVASSGEITIAPNSVEPFTFDTVQGISTVRIEPGDDFSVDDEAYIATPSRLQQSVVLVTNQEHSHLELALRSAPDIAVHAVNPPVLTVTEDGEKINPYEQDAIVMYQVDTGSILPGTMQDIEQYVREGGSFVYAAQQDLGQLDLGDMSLVELTGNSARPTEVCVDTLNSVTQSFQNEQCFTTVTQHMRTELSDDGVVFATAEGSPVLAYKDLEAGNVAYYGIYDWASDFRNLPAYPVYWNTLLNFMIGTEDISEYNHNTGKIVTIEEQEVQTPSGSTVTSKLLMDEQGIYSFNGREIAVNLLSEDESEVSALGGQGGIGQGDAGSSADGEQTHEFSLVFLMTFLALLLVVFELVYIKMRGDV